MPKWNTISVSGYHIREAGSTALQELAFTLRDGLEYVQWGVDAGLDVDAFVPQISFFFNAHSDFFEEIAKYRAARQVVGRGDARPLRRQERAIVEAALPQPDRRRLAHRPAAVQQRRPHGAAGALGGARRHQLAAHQLARRGARAADRPKPRRSPCARSRSSRSESGVTNVVDPLGGSYFVEKLTKDMEDGALAYFEQIDRMGGMVEAIERGFPQKEIAESSYRFQQAVERREKIIVGVNDFVQEDEPPIQILYIDESAAEKQLAKLEQLKKTRNNGDVDAALDALRTAARGHRQPDAADPRRGARVRDGRRNVRRAARGVGRVRGSADHLVKGYAEGKRSKAEVRKLKAEGQRKIDG